jgi:hypothetical protein
MRSCTSSFLWHALPTHQVTLMRAEDPIVTAQKWREMRNKAAFAALILAPLGALMIAADVRRKRDPIQNQDQDQDQQGQQQDGLLAVGAGDE